MNFGEGPWWVPGVVLAVITFAILTAPAQSGQLVRTVGHGIVTFAENVTGDDIESPITIEAQP